jgi:hypothetical protein
MMMWGRLGITSSAAKNGRSAVEKIIVSQCQKKRLSGRTGQTTVTKYRKCDNGSNIQGYSSQIPDGSLRGLLPVTAPATTPKPTRTAVTAAHGQRLPEGTATHHSSTNSSSNTNRNGNRSRIITSSLRGPLTAPATAHHHTVGRSYPAP